MLFTAAVTHCYSIRLNLEKMGPLQFCLQVFLGIHRHPMQKEFLKSCEGFLRAALKGHGHLGPFWKIAKMALFDLCMEFEFFLGQMTSFESAILWLYPKNVSGSAQLRSRMNSIISTIPHRISKILFVYGSNEFLAMLEGKIREAPFFKGSIW